MMYEVQSYALIFQDMLYSLAVGFLAGFINQFLAVFLFKNKKAVFIRDIIMSVIFTVLVFSFSVSFANYKMLRWHNVIMSLIGLIRYHPCFAKGGHLIVLLFSSVVVFVLRVIKIYLNAFLHKQKLKISEKRKKSECEKIAENLKTEDKMLYN